MIRQETEEIKKRSRYKRQGRKNEKVKAKTNEREWKDKGVKSLEYGKCRNEKREKERKSMKRRAEMNGDNLETTSLSLLPPPSHSVLLLATPQPSHVTPPTQPAWDWWMLRRG